MIIVCNIINDINNNFYHVKKKRKKYQVSFRVKTLYSVFTRENHMLCSHVKSSPLLWLHNKSRFSQQKTIQLKWFGIWLMFV